MSNEQPHVAIIADDPRCLEPLCGVSTLERLLRILQRLRFSDATIFAREPEKIRAAIEPPNWARHELRVQILPRDSMKEGAPVLRIPAELYCDARLLRALAQSPLGAELIDSSPPEFVKPLLAKQNSGSVIDCGGPVGTIDAATMPTYIVGMRRHIRPVFFPAPAPELRHKAERIILDTGQNGTLDIPAILQSPVEDLVMRWLWRTPITPNQITAFGVFVALLATIAFATGHLWLGMIPALAIGVIDGLDGKQARVKIETTDAGKWEHVLDFFVETSWWAALAFWFSRSGQLPGAWICFGVIMVAEGVDQFAKRAAKKATGRLLDDVAPFDRFVRRIGARRDIYIWVLTLGLAFGVAARTYMVCAILATLTAIVHVTRALMLRVK